MGHPSKIGSRKEDEVMGMRKRRLDVRFRIIGRRKKDGRIKAWDES